MANRGGRWSHHTGMRGIDARWRATCGETVEQLSAYLEGDLEPSTRHRVAKHLRGCARCRTLLASLRHTIEQLRSLRAAPENGRPSVAEAVMERILGERWN
jgi:anti-sigma factor RsiW